MTSARTNWLEPKDTGYCLSKDGLNLWIRIIITTILAEREIELGFSVP